MQLRHKNLYLLTTAALSLGVGGKQIPDETKLQAPELEIQMALATLDNIERGIGSAEKLNSGISIGLQNVTRQRAFDTAKTYFKAGEFLSTIRELNVYLNLSQVPEPAPYLEAQYMLGRAYEVVGFDSRALRAYMRYIGSFMTQKSGNANKLLDVMQRLMPLAVKKTTGSQEELKQLLSSVTSLTLPEEQKAEVFYHAASSASKAKKGSLASEWFKKAHANSKDPAIRVRALYFDALISLANNDFAAAEKLLQTSRSLEGEAAREYRDLATLALARIAVKKRDIPEAFAYYREITADSPQLHHALFEQTYLNLNAGNDTLALKFAQDYLARFPNGSEAYQLKTLSGYLQLRTGKLKEAASSISDADQDLDSMYSELRKSYRDKEALNHADVNYIMSRADNRVIQSPIIVEGQKVYSMLAETKRRLADVRGSVRNLLYTLGRTNIEEFRPYWVRRSEQLKATSHDVLMVGHKLVSSYKFILDKHLSAVHKHELSASQKRRESLLSHPAQMLRRRSMWANWINLVDLNQEVAGSHNQLKKMRAELASASSLMQSEKPDANRASELKALKRRIAGMESKVGRSLELVRAQKVLDLINQGPHKRVQKFHTQYANFLHEEANLLRNYLDETTEPSLRYLAQDAMVAMDRWETVSKSVYNQLEAVNQSIDKSLKGFVSKIDNLQAQDAKLRSRIQDIERNLSSLLGTSANTLLSHYKAQVGVRKSRHNKWQADIEWLRFNNLANKKDEDNKRFKLEEQVLKDNLRDLQQGVLWQWPE